MFCFTSVFVSNYTSIMTDCKCFLPFYVVFCCIVQCFVLKFVHILRSFVEVLFGFLITVWYD